MQQLFLQPYETNKNVHSCFNYTPKTMNKEGAISIESHRNNNIL